MKYRLCHLGFKPEIFKKFRKNVLFNDGYFACSTGEVSSATIQNHIESQGLMAMTLQGSSQIPREEGEACENERILFMKEEMKWCAAFGNAISVRDQTEVRFSKDLTLRYPVHMVFSGERIRIHFSNLSGQEKISFRASIARAKGDYDFFNGRLPDEIRTETIKEISLSGRPDITVLPGEDIISDEIPFTVTGGEILTVSIYLEDYTDMNSSVLIKGPWSGGFYSYGDFHEAEKLPPALTRKTSWISFLETVDIYTSAANHALICYGDSITAQDWPDHLQMMLWLSGKRDISIIRRAVCGTRILREYSSITYRSYGLKGERRFGREICTDGAEEILIQHGINDIIHPVGKDNNIFRPMSDLPTLEELKEGFRKIYIDKAREKGFKVYAGTLLPIKGWRTYQDFREVLRQGFNQYLREEPGLDNVVDFDRALRDPEDKASFFKAYGSDDHLHPSEAGYIRMAKEVYRTLFE